MVQFGRHLRYVRQRLNAAPHCDRRLMGSTQIMRVNLSITTSAYFIAG